MEKLACQCYLCVVCSGKQGCWLGASRQPNKNLWDSQCWELQFLQMLLEDLLCCLGSLCCCIACLVARKRLLQKWEKKIYWNQTLKSEATKPLTVEWESVHIAYQGFLSYLICKFFIPISPLQSPVLPLVDCEFSVYGRFSSDQVHQHLCEMSSY